jgi:hypothetical protein
MEQLFLTAFWNRERRHWLRMLERAKLPQLLEPAVSKAVAAIWWIGGLPSLEMTRLFLRCIPLLAGEQEAVLHAIATGLREIYGGRLWVDPLQPDILADRLVSTENEGEPGSVSKIVQTYNQSQEGSG